jgi:4-hydroxy-tetrahydrodipicolinate synthase
MFEGSAVAIVTPFKDGAVDEKKLEELVNFQIAGGTSTLVPCGTTGESATLSHEEHGRVIELVIRFARGRAKVLAGAGSNATSEAVELTRHAKAAGADGALHITPYYNKPTQRGMVEHFRAIARATDLPIILYNVPGRTGVNMLPPAVIELARSEKNIVGIKEASGSLEQASEIVAALPEDFVLLSGEDSLTLPLLSVGAKGVISVVANIVPREVADLCAAWAKGDLVGARRIHQKLLPLSKAMFYETNPIPVKTAMGWLDLCSPELRLPLVGMDKANEEKLERALRDHGLVGPRRKHAGC